MQLANAVVLVTGANRGIGLVFAREALARGARRVYAAAHELRTQGTQVTALHMGFVDTDLTRGIDMPKSTPEAIVRAAYDGLEAGLDEVLADDLKRQVKQSLSSVQAAYLAAQ